MGDLLSVQMTKVATKREKNPMQREREKNATNREWDEQEEEGERNTKSCK